MTWPHCMVDVECFGPPPGGAIVRVGIVPFDPEAGVAPGEEWLDVGLSVAENVRGGRVVGERELAFWSRPQNAVARARLWQEPLATDVRDLRERVARHLCGLGGNLMVWAKPPAYDLRMVADLLRDPLPWSRRNELCLRTLLRVGRHVGMEPPAREAGSLHHSAADDAAHQAAQAVWVLRQLRRL